MKSRVRRCRHCEDNVQWDQEMMGWVDGGGSTGCAVAPDPNADEETNEPDWNTPAEWAYFLSEMKAHGLPSAKGWWTAEELVSNRSMVSAAMPLTRFSEFPTARQLSRWLENRKVTAFGGHEVYAMADGAAPKLWRSRPVETSEGAEE